ncbi:MAG: hypothetical protein JO150_11110, partial [Acidobacteriaceae bacterium]|nr:hypothetical protein [Acidobacteriaceae bacterium]
PPSKNNGYNHAFLYSKGQLQDLNDLIDPALHLILQEAKAINDHGQIVVNERSSSGIHAYLLTPRRHRKHEPCSAEHCEDSDSDVDEPMGDLQ